MSHTDPASEVRRYLLLTKLASRFSSGNTPKGTTSTHGLSPIIVSLICIAGSFQKKEAIVAAQIYFTQATQSNVSQMLMQHLSYPNLILATPHQCRSNVSIPKAKYLAKQDWHSPPQQSMETLVGSPIRSCLSCLSSLGESPPPVVEFLNSPQTVLPAENRAVPCQATQAKGDKVWRWRSLPVQPLPCLSPCPVAVLPSPPAQNHCNGSDGKTYCLPVLSQYWTYLTVCLQHQLG